MHATDLELQRVHMDRSDGPRLQATITLRTAITPGVTAA
jgi:hypothetical protein